MKIKKKFIVFGQPYLGSEEIKSVTEVIKSKWLGTGPKVVKFEEAFKNYKKAKFANAVSSATAALHLSLLSCNLKPGDEVITTSMTFCSTVNAIIHSGAIPVLADIDYNTGNIDVGSIKKVLSSKTKAIIPVHYAGQPCDMDAIIEIANEKKLKIIEDCAHAVETEYKGKKAGTLGDFGCFSFYSTKNLATGEGGMVLSKSISNSLKIKKLSLHGISKDAWKRFSHKGYNHYKVTEAGFKYNMMDLQAAIGLEQLKRINKNWKIRKKIWNIYHDDFYKTNLKLLPKISKKNKLAYHLFPILVNKACGISRNQLLVKLTKAGIGCGVHYEAIPIHPYYKKKFSWKLNSYPNAASFGRETLSLPISPSLGNNQIDYIINTVKKFVK